MWSKITNALKPRQTQEASTSQPTPRQQQGDVMHKVLEQHPNLPVLVPPTEGSSSSNASPPPSPSKSTTKRSMLKRLSKLPTKEDLENAKTAGSLRLTKKSRPELNFKTVGSNSPLAQALNESSSSDLSRRASYDVLGSNQYESQKPARSSIDVLKRPSLDLLRNEGRSTTPQPLSTQEEAQGPSTPAADRMGSVRSILRDPKTPGTGQNVRFFSRDAYKVISPEVSMDTEERFFNDALAPPAKDEPALFLDRLHQASSDTSNPPAAFRPSPKSSSKPPRPSISDLFSPLNDAVSLPDVPSQDEESATPTADNSNDLFDVSQTLPPFNPPGLDSSFDQSLELDVSFDKFVSKQKAAGEKQRTSTPFAAKVAPKQEDLSSDSASLEAVDDSIFHGTDVPPRFPSPLHDRTPSFSAGQTAFFSVGEDGSRTSSKMSAAYASSILRGESSSPASSANSSTRSRARAISDTVLQNMLRSTKTPPEADINDKSGDQLQVYASPPAPEPDPFSAYASTYYTPQVMIPVTPPSKQHIRKTSKEENLIYSLQTQLSLQNDLCQQYEIDLRARDEMVVNLTQKLAEVEKEDNKRRATLRSWKKKVQDLERACRQLEDEVDSSRQMSFERSVMDEASGEALRMLHRQIAALEKEKADQLRREEILKDEVATLELMLKDKSEDVTHLKEMLWNRDESEKELEAGLRAAREQMEQLSNVSVVIDEEEMKRLMSEKQQASDDQTRHRIREVAWQHEREELLMKLEGLEIEKASLEEEVEKIKQSQGQPENEDYAVLKAELEAQWSNTETMSEKIDGLEKEKIAIEIEREQLQRTVSDLESRMSNMELEWNEYENKKQELENQMQEAWQANDALTKEREQLEYDLQQAEGRIQHFDSDLRDRDNRIHELEEELQFNKSVVARGQENVRKCDEEISEQANRIRKMQVESEALREQLNTMTREYNRLLDDQSRADRSNSNQEAEMQARIEQLIKQKAEVDIELKSTRDQVAALQDEMDRLRRQVHNLKQVSADADVEIGRLKKQHTADKEDIFGLNMALDAKQQELDLIKRQVGVRGTAGPAPAKSVSSTSTTRTHRRDSSVFTATPLVRPPSAASDVGESISASKALDRKRSSERPGSSASVSRPSSTTLGRSNRPNTTSSNRSSASAPAKPRSSVSPVSATPAPTSNASKAVGRSNSTRSTAVSPNGTPVPHRKVASVVASLNQKTSTSNATKSGTSRMARMTSPVSSVPESDEKENFSEDMATPTVTSRRVAVPAP